MNNFDITQEESESIFHKMILPQVIGGILPQKAKRAFILGGQPGSGKSAFAREILIKNKDIVFINGDDLRAYHPKYYFYLKENDIEAADMTQSVCNFWIESLIRECIKRSLNFIVEGTMRKKDASLQTAFMLRDAGYHIDLVVISTPYEMSLSSLNYRYQELKKLGQIARFTKKESHDEVFRNIESVLVALIDSRLFESVHIYKRGPGGFKGSIFETMRKEKILQDFRMGRISIIENERKEMPLADNERRSVLMR